MKKLFKSVLSMVLCLSLLCGITVFAAVADPEVCVWEASSRIMISGQVDAAKAGQYATVMLVDKDANINNLQNSDVGYLNQIKILEGGYYKFVTTIDQSVSNYELRMNIAGEDITKSVISATTDNNMISTSFDVDRGLTSADINVAFSNELLVAGETYTIITAYYDNGGKLLTSKATQVANISAETMASKVKTSTTYVSGAKTLKVFVWDSTENVIPLCDHEEIEIAAPLTVACWGDSLTQGKHALYDNGDIRDTTGTAQKTGEITTAYPEELAKLTGYTVHNMGVGGETATTIAARQGALDIVTTETFIIPAGVNAVDIDFKASNGGVVIPRGVNAGGWSPCTIAGVEGKLSVAITGNSPYQISRATFTRTTAGESVVVPAGTKIIPEAHKMEADINIFFMGTNGGWTTAHTTVNDNSDADCEALVELYRKQIAKAGKSKYIIVGLTWGYTNANDNINNHLREAFGGNFLDLKAYLASEQALIDAGITPTQEDLARIAGGHVPTSLIFSDGVHFTSKGYELIAQQVYAKMIELGYCEAN